VQNCGLRPPHITDEPILAQMQRIGIERRKSFDIDKVDSAIKAGLESGPENALKLMARKVNSLDRVVNGWSINTDTMGVYGNYYLKRAIVAQAGLGARAYRSRMVREPRAVLREFETGLPPGLIDISVVVRSTAAQREERLRTPRLRGRKALTLYPTHQAARRSRFQQRRPESSCAKPWRSALVS
jgi:hypothetical protein